MWAWDAAKPSDLNRVGDKIPSKDHVFAGKLMLGLKPELQLSAVVVLASKEDRSIYVDLETTMPFNCFAN